MTDTRRTPSWCVAALILVTVLSALGTLIGFERLGYSAPPTVRVTALTQKALPLSAPSLATVAKADRTGRWRSSALFVLGAAVALGLTGLSRRLRERVGLAPQHVPIPRASSRGPPAFLA